MWSDRLTSKEARYTQRALDELALVQWAKPLLSRLDKAGGIKSDNMPLMFEVRFAHELHLAGVAAQYEYPAGVGDSTIEFRTQTSPPWLIELVSVRTSDAAKRAIRQVGLIYEQLLSLRPGDPARSEEAEMITAEQKIGEKVFADGKPTKFPSIGNNFHLIVTDIRGYLDEGGDIFDYREMVYGARGIPRDQAWMFHYWKDGSGTLRSIRGLFEETNPLLATKLIQERIHFLGFVREREYEQGEIISTAYHLANPHLFSEEGHARKALASYPLSPKASQPAAGADYCPC